MWSFEGRSSTLRPNPDAAQSILGLLSPVTTECIPNQTPSGPPDSLYIHKRTQQLCPQAQIPEPKMKVQEYDMAELERAACADDVRA